MTRGASKSFHAKKTKQIIMIIEYTINLTKSWTDLLTVKYKTTGWVVQNRIKLTRGLCNVLI